MIWIILLSGLVASGVEGYFDRHGESRKDKVKDAIWQAAVALCLCLLACYVGHTNPLKVIVLFLAVRILVFDYWVTYLLIKNNVIVGQWWNYTGQTARWDKFIAKVNWKVRLVVRVLFFLGALFYFLYVP